MTETNQIDEEMHSVERELGIFPWQYHSSTRIPVDQNPWYWYGRKTARFSWHLSQQCTDEETYALVDDGTNQIEIGIAHEQWYQRHYPINE